MPKSFFWANDIDKRFYLNDAYAYTVDPDNPANYWYYMTLNGTELFNFNINHNPDLNVTNFWINAPVYDPYRKPIGILGTGVDVSVFIDTVFNSYADNVPLFFFNKAGEITGAMDKSLVANKVTLENELGKTGEKIYSEIKKLEDNEARYFSIPGGITAVAAIHEFDWYICAIIPIGLRNILGTSMTILFAAMMAVVAGIFIIFNLLQSNFALNKERNIYKSMSITDALTGIYNRRFLEENLERTLKTLSRSGASLSVLMLDIDYFKNYNDTYGHNMGDACLKTLANTFAQSIVRANDFVARFGGEEFAIVLPNVDEQGADTVAQRILNDVRERNIPHTKSDVARYVTVSIGGVTGKVTHSCTGADFLKKADQALYISKQNGRDRYTAVDMLTAPSAVPFYHKN
jgi:diguanylate cyclase (GGDEF)-like protein